MSKAQLVNGQPSEPGYYWVRFKAKNRVPAIVFVYDQSPGIPALRVCLWGTSYKFDTSMIAEYIGPLSNPFDKPEAPKEPELDPKLATILMHALGANRPDVTPGYRNYYATSVGFVDCERLVDMGLMYRGNGVNDGRDMYYHVTDKGKKLVGVEEQEYE